MTHHRSKTRTGLTLTELLVATTVTTLIVAAIGAFAHAALQGSEASMQAGNATQAGRVVLARIAHKTETSRQVFKISDTLGATTGMDQVLLVWERDGEPDDPTPGLPNFVELLIYARAKYQPSLLWELRPQVDPALVVPTDQPALLFTWIDRFRSGQDVVQPPAVVLDDLGGIYFDVAEYTEPQGIAGLVQQNVQISLCISPRNQPSTVFFGSAMRRYLTGK